MSLVSTDSVGNSSINYHFVIDWIAFNYFALSYNAY